MKRTVSIIAAVAGILMLLLSFGCEKDVIKSCDYIIAPRLEAAEGDEQNEAMTTPDNLVAYAFFVITGEWTVASRDDAAQGLITNIETGATMNPDLTQEQDSEGKIVFAALEGELNMLIIVYDRDNDIYAWRDDARVVGNLAQVNALLIFRPWKEASAEGVSYTEQKWKIFNHPKEPDDNEGEEGEEGEGGDDPDDGTGTGGTDPE